MTLCKVHVTKDNKLKNCWKVESYVGTFRRDIFSIHDSSPSNVPKHEELHLLNSADTEGGSQKDNN